MSCLPEESAIPGSLIPVEFEGAKVRIVTVEGQPWLHLGDVCGVLAYSNSRVAARLVSETDRCKINLVPIAPGGVRRKVSLRQESDDPLKVPPGRNTEAWFVSESGLYELILRSRVPAAARFRGWITHEILPKLRKDRAYLDPRATTAELIRVRAEIDTAIEFQELVNAADSPADLAGIPPPPWPERDSTPLERDPLGYPTRAALRGYLTARGRDPKRASALARDLHGCWPLGHAPTYADLDSVWIHRQAGNKPYAARDKRV